MTTSPTNGSIRWGQIPATIGFLTALVLCIVFVIRSDSKAEQAIERTADQESRLRVLEKCATELQGDVRYIRQAFEKQEKERGK